MDARTGAHGKRMENKYRNSAVIPDTSALIKNSNILNLLLEDLNISGTARTINQAPSNHLNKPIKLINLGDLSKSAVSDNVTVLTRNAANEGKIGWAQVGKIQENYQKTPNGDRILLTCLKSSNCDLEAAYKTASYSQLHNKLFLKYPHLSKTAIDKKIGALSEEMMHKYFLSSGWTKLEGGIGVHGIDGLYVKRDKAGKIVDTLIVESKYNKSNLRRNSSGDKQMSKEWILEKIRELQKANPNNIDYKDIHKIVSNDDHRARLWRLKLDDNKLSIDISNVDAVGATGVLSGSNAYKINKNGAIDITSPNIVNKTFLSFIFNGLFSC